MNRIGSLGALVTADEHVRTRWRHTSPLRTGLALVGAALLAAYVAPAALSLGDDAPAVADDEVATTEDTSVSIPVAALLANDDPGLRLASHGQPSNGFIYYDHILDALVQRTLGLRDARRRAALDPGDGRNHCE